MILVACQPAHAQPEQGAQQARAAAAALAPYEPPQFAAAPAAMASCGRARSRVAREIVQEHIISPAAAVGFELPAACSLAPSNDVLSTHEQSKSKRRRGQWQCGICGKLFRTEEHLDQHLQNRHGDLSPPGARVCLADLCDVLHCDAKLPGATAASLRRQPCRAHDMERARHQCEAHLHQCFPPGAPPQLAHRFQETFCDTLTCDARHKAVAMLRPAVSAWRVWWWIGLVMAIVVNVAVLASLTWRNVQVRGAGTGEARCICWRHVSRLRFGRGARWGCL